MGATSSAGGDKTIWRRTYKGLIEDLASQGVVEPTYATLQLVERAASLTVSVRKAEDALVRGEPFDPGAHANLTNLLLRILGSLGLGDFRTSTSPALKPKSTGQRRGSGPTGTSKEARRRMSRDPLLASLLKGDE
ncbi:MAG: hypothetical protein U1E62_01475 [Alsobacter sp.]